MPKAEVVEALKLRFETPGIRGRFIRPTLSKDQVVDPAVCRSVVEFNPGATVVEFPDAGHAPFIEEPARYNRELLDFLGEHLG